MPTALRVLRDRLFSFFPLVLVCTTVLTTQSGCMITYLASSARGQSQLYWNRVPLERALSDPSLNEQTRRKLQLVKEARDFAETHLRLRPTTNFRHYVDLKRPFVTWVVSRAPRNRLEHIKFWYPVVGSMPYKGFFVEAAAQSEAQYWRDRGEDVFVRGVSAYSTLGWFSDPVLSSMLRMGDFDLVDTVIHETVHATVFIKSQADFNERLATFLGQKGAQLFFQAKEGANSESVRRHEDEGHDQEVFSAFITKELDDLQKWYLETDSAAVESQREEKFKAIRDRFVVLRDRFKDKGAYAGFLRGEMNNARLMTYRMYLGDLQDFEKAWRALGSDFASFLALARRLADSRNPLEDLQRAGEAKGTGP